VLRTYDLSRVAWQQHGSGLNYLVTGTRQMQQRCQGERIHHGGRTSPQGYRSVKNHGSQSNVNMRKYTSEEDCRDKHEDQRIDDTDDTDEYS